MKGQIISRKLILGLMVLAFCASAFSEDHGVVSSAALREALPDSAHPSVIPIERGQKSLFQSFAEVAGQKVAEVSDQVKPVAASLLGPGLDTAFGRNNRDVMKSLRMTSPKEQNDEKLDSLLSLIQDKKPDFFRLASLKSGKETDSYAVSGENIKRFEEALKLLKALRAKIRPISENLEHNISPFLKELHKSLVEESQPAVSFSAYDQFMRELSGRATGPSLSDEQATILKALRPILADLNVSIRLPPPSVDAKGMEASDLRTILSQP